MPQALAQKTILSTCVGAVYPQPQVPNLGSKFVGSKFVFEFLHLLNLMLLPRPFVPKKNLESSVAMCQDTGA